MQSLPGRLGGRIHLPVREMLRPSRAQEDHVRRGATKPKPRSYCACALEPGSRKHWAHELQALRPRAASTEARVPKAHAPQWEAHALQLEKSPCAATKTQHSQKQPQRKLKNQDCAFTSSLVLSHFSSVWLSATLWTAAHQVPPSMGVSRQEYWSGSPCPSPGDLPDPGMEPGSPAPSASQADSSLLSHQGSPTSSLTLKINSIQSKDSNEK